MTLYTQTYGDPNAPTILFLHGAGVSSWMWTEQIQHLSQRFHCITVDLPGNGESYQQPWLSLADSADQVANIIRNEAFHGKAHVVGLSLGGYTALTLLQRHPGLVESVLVSGVTVRPFSRQWLYKPLLFVTSLLNGTDLMINMNIRMMQIPDDVREVFIRDNKRASGKMLRNLFGELVNFMLPDGLERLPHRVLAVAGDQEAKMIQDSLADVPAKMRNGEARIAPNAHHAWNGEHPHLFTEMIQAWVECQPLPEALQRV
jgi:pimeloyl-ACP methyl ester carboxylesterase